MADESISTAHWTSMKSSKSKVKAKWRSAARFAFALLLCGWCGCAHLATVKTKPARLPAELANEEPLESARKYLSSAEHEPPLPALGHDLLAAMISQGVLERQPHYESARDLSLIHI